MIFLGLFVILLHGGFDSSAGLLDCICFSKDARVKGDNGEFLVPMNKCVQSFDEVSGLRGEVWHHIKYTSQTGWIEHDKQIMKLVICGREELSRHICLDNILDCKQYNETNPNLCNHYPDWSRDNCRRFCGFCDEGCLDKQDNCHLHTQQTCKTYSHWAKVNCKNYCGLCDYPATTTPLPTTTFSCVDPPGNDCPFLKSQGICDDPDDAKAFCPKYCQIPECKT
ncbi:hypothetical protein SNE40_018034 [Patella caerulea]|uniref:ShKT domain-containing protein n=1 Tax=Patella caerulea TaxID=87958 RepID=A0AAN8JAJ3_PATCE